MLFKCKVLSVKHKDMLEEVAKVHLMLQIPYIPSGGVCATRFHGTAEDGGQTRPLGAKIQVRDTLEGPSTQISGS